MYLKCLIEKFGRHKFFLNKRILVFRQSTQNPRKRPSNRKSGKLNLPPYHPVHKNPIWYDDDVQEIYDASGNKKKDQVDIVRRQTGFENFFSKFLSLSLHFLQNPK